MAQASNTPSSKRSRLTQRISAVTDTHINGWPRKDRPDDNEGYLYNAIVEKYKNDPDRAYVTHRPNLDLLIPDTVGDSKGRGIYWWSAKQKYYFMNDDVIYKDNYAGPCSLVGGHTAVVSGTSKVYFAEWSSVNEDYLFIFDPENDDVYCIASAADTTVINIGNVTSGTGTPFHASDSWDFDDLNAFLADEGLAHGAVALDTYLFLGTTVGKIINSNVGDWLNWNALNFTSADRSPDELFFIAKQQDHVVAVGGNSIEILYNNSNATGSPLSFRTDIAHRIGTPFAESCWEYGDVLYFIALDAGGDYTLASLQNFQINWHRNPAMQQYLWWSRYADNLTHQAHGFSVGGHVYYVLNVLDAGSCFISIVYDASTDLWAEWETTVGTQTSFQIMGYTPRSADSASRPYFIMRNGDIGLVGVSHSPIDYLVSVAEDPTFTMKITTGPFDANTTEDKFMHSVSYVGNQAQATLAMTIEWSDDDGANWNSSTLDLKDRTSINRLGKFVSRRFRFTLGGGVYTRFEGVDVNFSQGGY